MTEPCYRTIEDPAFEPLLDVWTGSFGEPSEVFACVWRGSAPGQRSAAIAELDGRMVGSVMMYCYPVSDGKGGEILIGGIANVSTLPELRGKGISAKLLDLAISTFAAKGVGFSLLYTGIPSHYARHGYVPFPDWVRQISPAASAPIAPVDALTVDMVAPIHASCYGRKAFAMARSDDWWNEVVLPRMAKDHAFISEKAYIVAREGEGEFMVIEAMGRDDEVASLVAGACCWARNELGCDSPTSRVALPASVEIGALSKIDGPMQLPILMSVAESQTFTASPSSNFLLLDHF